MTADATAVALALAACAAAAAMAFGSNPKRGGPGGPNSFSTGSLNGGLDDDSDRPNGAPVALLLRVLGLLCVGAAACEGDDSLRAVPINGDGGGYRDETCDCSVRAVVDTPTGEPC